MQRGVSHTIVHFPDRYMIPQNKTITRIDMPWKVPDKLFCRHKFSGHKIDSLAYLDPST